MRRPYHYVYVRKFLYRFPVRSLPLFNKSLSKKYSPWINLVKITVDFLSTNDAPWQSQIRIFPEIKEIISHYLLWIFCPQMTLHDVPIHMWIFCPQMTLHHIPGFSGTFVFITWYLWMMTSRDKTKWCIARATHVVSYKHEVKKFYWCMTSSELKKCLWIFCPQRTPHDIPKIPQIGVKDIYKFLLIQHTWMNHFLNSFPGTSYEKLSSLMSMPLSTSTTTNDYIDSINSEFSFQLAEMTVFQFPNSDQRKFQI